MTQLIPFSYDASSYFFFVSPPTQMLNQNHLKNLRSCPLMCLCNVSSFLSSLFSLISLVSRLILYPLFLPFYSISSTFFLPLRSLRNPSSSSFTFSFFRVHFLCCCNQIKSPTVNLHKDFGFPSKLHHAFQIQRDLNLLTHSFQN